MAGERAAIFGLLIERLEESELTTDSRKEVYDILIDVLDEFEISGMETYLDIDPAFDETWRERYPEMEDEDD